mgnify:CR=1 FL=1
MEVYLNRVDGIDDAIISMFLSKRTLTRELEMDVRNEVAKCSNHSPGCQTAIGAIVNPSEKLDDWMKKLFKWGCFDLLTFHLLCMVCIEVRKMILIHTL